MTIIAILMAISGTVISNFLSRAREEGTRATIQKIHGMIQQRREAIDRVVSSAEFASVAAQIISDLKKNNVGFKSVSDGTMQILLKKELFRRAFPQRFHEAALQSPVLLSPSARDLGADGQPGVSGTDDDGDGVTDNLTELGWSGSDDGSRMAESSELLYAALTEGRIFGTAPVGDDEFSTDEIGDSDGDGLREFVDKWGRPFRFYRWPTRLLKPFGVSGQDGQPGAVNVDDDLSGTQDDVTELGWKNTDDEPWRDLAQLLIQGLPAEPSAASDERDPLNEDPDDQLDRLVTETVRLYMATNGNLDLRTIINETNWHTLMTYHEPLIVSMGSDSLLGLREPYELNAGSGIYGTLAQPNGNVSNPSELARVIGELTDNLTNRNRRAGGN